MHKSNDLSLGFLVYFWGFGIFLEVMEWSWFVWCVLWDFGEVGCWCFSGFLCMEFSINAM